jgi:hypothetical protein
MIPKELILVNQTSGQIDFFTDTSDYVGSIFPFSKGIMPISCENLPLINKEGMPLLYLSGEQALEKVWAIYLLYRRYKLPSVKCIR